MEQIKNKEWEEVVERVKLGRRPKYDFDKCFDGNIYRFTHGEDFDCSMKSFMQLARLHAKQAGLYIRFRTEREKVVIFQTSVEKFPKENKKKLTNDVYKSAINFVSRRDKINQGELSEFFNLSKRQTKMIVKKLIEDGYLGEYDRSKSAYPTRFQVANTNLTVTTGKKAVKT